MFFFNKFAGYYLVSEFFLVLKRWRVLATYFAYFAIPNMLFQVLISSVSNSENSHFFNIALVAVFLTTLLIVVQFYVFNSVVYEHESGIKINKFSLPISNFSLLLFDILAQVFFATLLLFLATLFLWFFNNADYFLIKKAVISGLLFVFPAVVLTHVYTLIFFNKSQNSVISLVFCFAFFMPMLFFVSNFVHDVSPANSIIISIFYAIFVSVLYLIQGAIIIKNTDI